MITYDPETKTIHMSLVDLEHCGFDHDEFESELFLAGLDDKDKNLLWPDTLVVNFAGGAVKIAPDPLSIDPEHVFNLQGEYMWHCSNCGDWHKRENFTCPNLLVDDGQE